MVRFVGRSVHTVRMSSKPIPEGFKILALCEHGYTYSFMYTSRVDQFSGPRHNLPQALPNPEEGNNLHLSPTSHAVFSLATQLPYQQYRFLPFVIITSLIFHCSKPFGITKLQHVEQ